MKSINHNAPVTCSKTIVINATPETVWHFVTEINNWPSWQKDISFASLNGPLSANSIFTWKTGGAKIKSILHTVIPYSGFGWTGKTFGMYAIHNWKIEADRGKTKVTVDESMEGLLARLFKKSFNRNLEIGMQSWLAMLKLTCEQTKN